MSTGGEGMGARHDDSGSPIGVLDALSGTMTDSGAVATTTAAAAAAAGGGVVSGLEQAGVADIASQVTAAAAQLWEEADEGDLDAFLGEL